MDFYAIFLFQADTPADASDIVSQWTLTPDVELRSLASASAPVLVVTPSATDDDGTLTLIPEEQPKDA